MKFLNNPGLYIHIPFCKHKCAYCNFYSAIPSEKVIEDYLSALSADIKNQGGLTDRLFDTLYIGGGTPSILGKQIANIVNSVKNCFNLSNNSEITVEVNPDVNDEFLVAAKKSGVNRISVGIQSGNDNELKVLGRNHTANEAKNAIERIKKAGFENISADLMIALPESNFTTLKANLDFFISLNIPHISVYILKLEKNTRFDKFTPILPSEEETADQYLYVCEYLQNKGYSHYEISNFALDGFESKHNLKYWECKEYLGLGPSAHSFMNGKRFYYKNDLKEYILNRTTVFDSLGGNNEEKIMLGLRLKNGIDLKDFGILNIPPELRKLSENSLINLNETKVSLTDKGMLVSNSIISLVLELIV